MRKLIVALILLMLTSFAQSQTNTFAALNLDQIWTGKQQIPLWNYTIAALPSSPAPFSVAIVTDSADGSCHTGGGGTIVLCTYTPPSGWIPLGGGGGGGGGGISGVVQGQPVYGLPGGATVQSVATELAADTFAGADICAKVTAAIAALPASGGVIRLSAQNYSTCAATITISKPNVTLRGSGFGNWGTTIASTVLNFPAGVSGIVGTAEGMVIENMFVKSASTAAGTDDGITMGGGSPRISRVVVQGFGRRGVVFNNNTDFWRLENVYSDSNKGDGFYFASGCTDENAGMGTVLSSTHNGGYGYNLQCGGANTFQTTHASTNTGGAWLVNVTYNYFWDTYVEATTGSSFTFTSTAAHNTAFFNAFGQPSTLTDSGVANTNTIHYDGAGGTDGAYPAQTSFSLTGPPQNSPGAFYSWIADSGFYGTSDLTLRDRKNATNVWEYVPTKGWTFLKPLFLGLDNSIAGSLTIANGSVAAHTTVQTQATGNTLFNLPSTNGGSGSCLISDGAGNTSWSSACGGSSVTPGGGPFQVQYYGTGGVFAGDPKFTTDGTGNVTANSLGAGSTTAYNGQLILTQGLSGDPGTPSSGMAIDAPTGGTITPYRIEAGPLVACTGYWYMTNTAGLMQPSCVTSPAVAFSALTGGTNTTAAMVVGTGASIAASGSGTISATTAANLSGTPALPNGTTATTQAVGDNSTKIATDAFVLNNLGTTPISTTSLTEYFCSGGSANVQIGTLGWALQTAGSAPLAAGVAGTYPHRCLLEFRTATAATQGQGGTLYIAPGGALVGWGDYSVNTNWSTTLTFSLSSIASSIFRFGLMTLSASIRPSYSINVVYDTNSPLSAAAISTMTCTATICTVTMAAAHNLLLAGQSFTIAGVTCPSRSSINATYAYGTATGVATIPNATAFTFNSAGSSETCTVGSGTVTTNAQTDFGFTTRNADNSHATVVDSTVAADTNFHTVTISSTVAGTVVFKIDSATPVSISTNVPSNTQTPSVVIGTDITAQKIVQLNYFNYTETGVTR